MNEITNDLMNGKTNNLIIICFLAFTVLLFLTILIKSNLLKIKTNRFNFGTSENEIRLKTLRELEWITEFILAERELFYASIIQKTKKINRTYLDLIMEKIQDLLVESILINHISRNSDYLRQKTLTVERLMIKMFGKCESDLILDSNILNEIKQSSSRIAESFIDGILHIRELEK